MKSRRWWKQNVELANNAIFIGFMKANDEILKGCIFEATAHSAQGIEYHAKKAYEDVNNEVVMLPTGKSIKVEGSTRYVIYLKRVK